MSRAAPLAVAPIPPAGAAGPPGPRARGSALTEAPALIAPARLCAPLARRLGLGDLLAGVVAGAAFRLGFFEHPHEPRRLAEFGAVLLVTRPAFRPAAGTGRSGRSVPGNGGPRTPEGRLGP